MSLFEVEEKKEKDRLNKLHAGEEEEKMAQERMTKVTEET